MMHAAASDRNHGAVAALIKKEHGMIYFAQSPILYIGHPSLGWILPALIFAVSFWVAWACYRHFTKKMQ